ISAAVRELPSFPTRRSSDLEAASAQDCRAFHQECMEARAEGYRDVGICNVERLECSADRVRVPEQSRERRDDDRNDAERAVGERDRKSTRLNSSHVSISYAV